MNDLCPKDGGFLSRKLILVFFALFLVFAGAVAAALWPLFAPNYETLVGGVIGLVAIYCGSNVGNKFVTKTAIKGREESSPP